MFELINTFDIIRYYNIFITIYTIIIIYKLFFLEKKLYKLNSEKTDYNIYHENKYLYEIIRQCDAYIIELETRINNHIRKQNNSHIRKQKQSKRLLNKKRINYNRYNSIGRK